MLHRMIKNEFLILILSYTMTKSIDFFFVLQESSYDKFVCWIALINWMENVIVLSCVYIFISSFFPKVDQITNILRRGTCSFHNIPLSYYLLVWNENFFKLMQNLSKTSKIKLTIEGQVSLLLRLSSVIKKQYVMKTL